MPRAPLLALTLALVLAGCASPGDPPCGPGCMGERGGSTGTPPEGPTVRMNASQYDPPTLTVRVGQTVTWINDDSVEHTVTSDSGSELDSPWYGQGKWWSHAFTKPGTYRYHCIPHASQGEGGAWSGMVGTIVVEA